MISNLLKHGAAFLIAMTVALAFQTVTGINITGVTLTAYQSGGDVVGPASAVNNQLVQFDGTTGKLIKALTSSGLLYAASGVPSALGGSGVVKLTSGVPSLVTGTSSNCVFVDGTSGSCGGGSGGLSPGVGLIEDPSGYMAVDPAAVTTYLEGSASLDFASMTSGRCSTDLTFTLAGALTGDKVLPAWPPTIDGGVLGMMWVSASDTIKVRVCNLTASSIDPASQSYGAMIQRSF